MKKLKDLKASGSCSFLCQLLSVLLTLYIEFGSASGGGPLCQISARIPSRPQKAHFQPQLRIVFISLESVVLVSGSGSSLASSTQNLLALPAVTLALSYQVLSVPLIAVQALEMRQQCADK